MELEVLILEREWLIRLGFFLGVFAVIGLSEVAAPRRAPALSRGRRWLANLELVAIDTVVLRLLFPAAAVGMALFAQSRGWGLFNNFVMPVWLVTVVCVIVLDFFIWLQHVMFHALPLLWRLHRVHHADLDIDVTTGLRFHPGEIVLSMLIKFAVIALLGPPVLAVIIFEILLNASSMFNHGNLRLPPALDRLLRLIIVTPDMHRVHHSVETRETNSNFGFNLAWWDRLFGTYRAQPDAGHDGMTIGIASCRDPAVCNRLSGMLAMPFSGACTAHWPTSRGRR